MATVETRELAGGVKRYRVVWRQAGLPERQVIPFYDEDRANDFCDLVEMNPKNVWPTADQLRAFGFGSLIEEPEPQPATVLLPGRPFGADVTFEEFATYFLEEELFPTGTVSGKEIAAYRQRLKKHVVPYFGKRPFAAITARELITWQNGLYQGNGGPLAVKSINNVRGTVVAPVFAAGCREGLDGEPPLRLTNPMLSVPTLDGPSREIEIMATPREAAIMYDSLYATGNLNFADMTVTAYALNLRYGEAAGMPVRAVERELRHSKILQALAEDEQRRWYIKPYPKTPAGFREAPWGEALVPIMDDWCDGREHDRSALLFPGRQKEFWIYRTYLNWWDKALSIAKDNGLFRELTPNSLRHGMLSVLARARIDGKSLQKAAGHKRFAFTYDRYIHPIQDAADEIREAAAPMLADVSASRRAAMARSHV